MRAGAWQCFTGVLRRLGLRAARREENERWEIKKGREMAEQVGALLCRS